MSQTDRYKARRSWGARGGQGDGELNDYRFRIWKSKSMAMVKLSLIRQQGAIGGQMGPQGVVGI